MKRAILTLAAVLALLSAFMALPTPAAAQQPNIDPQGRLRLNLGFDGQQLLTTGVMTDRAFGSLVAWDDGGRWRIVDAAAPLPVQFLAALPGPVDVVRWSAVALDDPFDLDTGAGTDTQIGVSLRLAALGGSVPFGTALNPIRIDPVGTTAQPVTSTQLPAALVGGRLDVNLGTALPAGTASIGVVQAPQAVPQVPVAVACDDTGAVNWTAHADDLRVTIWNTNTQADVCIRWGAVAGADRTDLTTCFPLGSYAGSDSMDMWETPQGMRVGGESFACDSSIALNVAVQAWRAE
ncbi:MAG: hypothetical protein ABIL09_00770 [Gemmatimonadota bacterium]